MPPSGRGMPPQELRFCRAPDGTRIAYARHVALDVFSPEESVALLARVAGPERILAEPEEAARIAELCGHLPIGVALAARRLRSRPVWPLAELAGRLRAEDHRLDQLAGGACPLGASFDLSYESLSPQQQHVFRFLGLHPGPDLTAHPAAALAETTVDDAELVLETLLDEHLLQQGETGRYRMHDLLREHARKLSVTHDQEQAPGHPAVCHVVPAHRGRRLADPGTAPPPDV